MNHLPKHFIIFGSAGALLLIAMGCWLLHQRPRSEPHLQWHVVDGRWAEANGVISVLTYGRGDMQIAGAENWKDYLLSADLRYDLLFPETHYGDAGLVMRVSDASEGVDSYRGYYAGLRADDQMLVLGRADYGWRELVKAQMPNPIRMGEWYHMELQAQGCSFTVSVVDPLQHTTRVQFVDHDCRPSGAVGLRSFYAQSSWRNVTVHLLQ